jgi:hypothetical protein
MTIVDGAGIGDLRSKIGVLGHLPPTAVQAGARRQRNTPPGSPGVKVIVGGEASGGIPWP